ncbi:MAG: CHRD domain-containing protein [Proteobacteria bacterium]|nr:MAG: CHRD domain-containing protein [Pseudomonadota bacterium]
MAASREIVRMAWDFGKDGIGDAQVHAMNAQAAFRDGEAPVVTAARGANAGVKVDFHDNVTTATGTFNRSITVDEVAIKEDSLLNGFYYFNIHTPENKGGEIRGQIEF